MNQEKCSDNRHSNQDACHISTAYTNTATLIPSASHIRPCKPIYSLSLRLPHPLLFPLYALSCTLYGHSCIMPVHCRILCTRHMRSIRKHPILKLYKDFKTKTNRPLISPTLIKISLQRIQRDIKKG